MPGQHPVDVECPHPLDGFHVADQRPVRRPRVGQLEERIGRGPGQDMIVGEEQPMPRLPQAHQPRGVPRKMEHLELQRPGPGTAGPLRDRAPAADRPDGRTSPSAAPSPPAAAAPPPARPDASGMHGTSARALPSHSPPPPCPGRRDGRGTVAPLISESSCAFPQWSTCPWLTSTCTVRSRSIPAAAAPGAQRGDPLLRPDAGVEEGGSTRPILERVGVDRPPGVGERHRDHQPVDAERPQEAVALHVTWRRGSPRAARGAP